jgi:hypothetical protein
MKTEPCRHRWDLGTWPPLSGRASATITGTCRNCNRRRRFPATWPKPTARRESTLGEFRSYAAALI